MEKKVLVVKGLDKLWFGKVVVWKICDLEKLQRRKRGSGEKETVK